MQPAYWWGATCLILLIAVELGRSLASSVGVRKSAATRDSVKQATSIIATLTALVLGLLIANGQQTFERQRASVAAIAVNVVRLDDVLRNYGEQSTAARKLLRSTLGSTFYTLWGRAGGSDLGPSRRLHNEAFIREITNLPSTANRQTLLRDDAYKIASALVQDGFGLVLMEGAGLPLVLLVTLIAWSFIVFVGVGLCSDESTISRIACHFAAAAAATAVFLVVEFDTPFSGLIQISHEPLTLISAALGEP